MRDYGGDGYDVRRVKKVVHRRGASMLCIWIGLMITTGCWAGCAGKTRISGFKPAEVSMGNIRTLAVLKFEGQYGESVRRDFYSSLANIQPFNLIDATQINSLDAVIYDQVDDPGFLPVLKDLKADGVIIGRVITEINDVEGSDQVPMQEGTGKYKMEKVFDVQKNVEIKKTVLKPVSYVIRQASLSAHFKVFDLGVQKVISTGKVTRSFKEKFGGYNEYAGFSGKKINELPARNETLNNLSSQAAAALVTKISPTEIVKEVQFDDGSKYGTGIGGHKTVKKGIEFAKQGGWEEAANIWQEVLSDEPDNAPALYNIGLAHENIGDLQNLEAGLAYYLKAYKNQKKPLYIDAITRIKNVIKDRTKSE